MHSQYLGKDKVVGFAEPTTDAVEVHELVDYDEIKEMMRGLRNHVSRKKQAKYKLPAVPIDNAFLTSPADIPGPRKVDLQDADTKPTTRSAFDALCEKYPTIFSRGNEDIGRTQLITMDIDTGDSPPVSSRPYTLALKHHQWVQSEIETLERAGVITKSMSPWASPIVVVPKKSQHGEPPKKRLCIDFRKINNLQQAVITEGKSKGCLSLVPLPKIDGMYAKLKGAKFFSTIDLRSGYYHIALGKDSHAKTAFVTPFGKYEFLQVPFGLAQAPAYFQHLMNQVLDKRGRPHDVHITDIKKINMTEKIASQLHEAYNNKGRTAKHLIPQGRIPDLGWNTYQQGTERQNLPNITPEAPVTQTTPEQVEGPPSSRLRSKTKIITPSNIMDPPQRNAQTVDHH